MFINKKGSEKKVTELDSTGGMRELTPEEIDRVGMHSLNDPEVQAYIATTKVQDTLGT